MGTGKNDRFSNKQFCYLYTGAARKIDSSLKKFPKHKRINELGLTGKTKLFSSKNV